MNMEFLMEKRKAKLRIAIDKLQQYKYTMSKSQSLVLPWAIVYNLDISFSLLEDITEDTEDLPSFVLLWNDGGDHLRNLTLQGKDC